MEKPKKDSMQWPTDWKDDSYIDQSQMVLNEFIHRVREKKAKKKK